MKTIKKYQKGSEVKGSKGGKASQIIAGISAAAVGAAGIGKNISNRRKAKKAAQEKAKMEAAGKEHPLKSAGYLDLPNASKGYLDKQKKMKYGGTKKPLRKAQDGRVVRTRDENVSATMYPYINPASNTINKSNKTFAIDDANETSVRASGPTATKKGPFGRTVQKTTTTDTTQPRDMYAPSGKAYGTKTTEKDVFNKKGQLIKSVSKERDINTGKLEKANRANYKTWTGQKGGVKMKTGGMVNSNSKVTALKVAGSKGVKSGVNSKVSASKVAKGRTGGTSSAPKTATPKAKMGGNMKKKSC